METPSAWKQAGSTVVRVRVPDDLMAWIDGLAAAEDRSRNYIIVRLLQRAREAAT